MRHNIYEVKDSVFLSTPKPHTSFDRGFFANWNDKDLIISNMLDVIKSSSFQLARNRASSSIETCAQSI